MKNNNELLENLPERILKPIHFNRTVCMAVDFLTDMASTESIEAIQTALRIQEGFIKEILRDLEEMQMSVGMREKAGEALHLNITVCMAIEMLSDKASIQSVEAIQTTLQIQEVMLNQLYKDIGKIAFSDEL
jgi:hypothetical protein